MRSVLLFSELDLGFVAKSGLFLSTFESLDRSFEAGLKTIERERAREIEKERKYTPRIQKCFTEISGAPRQVR